MLYEVITLNRLFTHTADAKEVRANHSTRFINCVVHRTGRDADRDVGPNRGFPGSLITSVIDRHHAYFDRRILRKPRHRDSSRGFSGLNLKRRILSGTRRIV